MLQIKNILLLLLIILGAVRSQNVNTSSSEWLLEDAFEDEHISLSEANYVLPSEVDEALTLYKNGFYRRAIEILEKERKLQLPDNRLDFITFLLAETYRQLKLKENARQEYEFITDNFPQSDKIPASYFRIMEFGAEEENADLTDSIYQVFRKNHLKHPLYNSVLFTYGKLMYKLNRFDDAIAMMSQIAKTSSVYIQAQFVSSLCYIQTKEVQKALFLLDYVKKNSTNKEITAEVTILIGDIYYSQNNLKVALESYKSISEKASRYHYAQVKAANAELDLGNFQNAKESARNFLKKYKDSENYFEMASILEQAYTKLGDEHNTSKIDGLIQRQIINVRLAFEIFQEVDHLVDLSKNWQILEYEASRTENHLLFEQSQNAKKKIKDLDTKYNLLLRIVDPSSDQKYSKSVPHLAERRYLALIKKKMSIVTDSINQMKGVLPDKSVVTKDSDSGLVAINDTKVNDSLTPLQKEYQLLDKEYSLVLKECLGGEYESKRADEEMQTKFVDWAFLRYQDKKETLKKMAEEISSQKKNSSKGDSTQAGKALGGALTQLNFEKIDKTIMDERNRLIDHVEMMQEIYKKNNYNSQILFRLAELYFDRSGDEFKEQLRLYDKRIENSKDTMGLVFPEYDLKKVVGIYDDIISQYPKSELSDDAYYYKAMALQKAGDDDGANTVMIKLVEKYPESEFFIEANMNIGKYYFERPKIENGTGYKIAEEAYRKVLFYRDHPQFVQALYHLGWCYYMQDKYDDAIAVFKYLVEEVKLDFDPTKMEEKQIVNPLLRGEAIDYIAISFDEEGKSEEVLKFLQLIGNDDYSALVLKRIAELRAEDLDFASAIKMYQSLLDQYPLSISAPDASIGLIKMYDGRDKADSALIEREKFFNLYCSGSKWNVEIAKRDSVLLTRIDSVAVAMGLYVADANYRNAEKFKNIDDYRKAANSYRNVVDKYPTLQRAAEARWNLAVILESKTFDKSQAYNEYLTYSKLVEIDSTRRIQAALNAIAISQSLLPPDTAAVKGSLDSSGEKAVEAVDNYLTLFPQDSSYSKVLMSLGAIYFNRQMFGKAEEIYNKVVSKGVAEKEYFEALQFVAQCNFGEEKWPKAITAFGRVWKESGNQIQQAIAFKFLLQAEFLYAKSHLATSNFELAATAFKAIDEKYPGSEYGDIALYNASEALEKKELWLKATECYYDLVKKYPNSKLAADALFNAASDFEKTEKFIKAAEAYEQLVSQYPTSDKVKDALFNLGLCYEKLGKLDLVAEVNERYSALYPGEKDVESMLLRSAAYYAKTGVFDKAINVYRNFIRRFPNSPKSIESLYMIAKCSYDQGDEENALLGFSQAEQQNVRFSQTGVETNNYYASEAAYHTAMIKRGKFLEIKLMLPDDQLKKSIKEKTDFLSDAAKAFQRVIQYQSERMFEAAYRVGQLYEDFSSAYKNQERPKLEPIPTAVLEKDILYLSSQLLQKSFIPYTKAIQLSKSFDSLGIEQKTWIQKSTESFSANCLTAGQLVYNSVGVMNDAPIPKEIQEKPLHYYQYIKQLLETLAPLKIQLAEYYSGRLIQLDSMKLQETDAAKACANQFVLVNYLVGDGYDRLASLILKRTQEITKDLTASEKEDLLFQLEDIVFELQDKAIIEYEDALQRIEKKQLSSNIWYTKIIECLARLSPDKYGASFYKTAQVISGSNWVVRSDSVANWNGSNAPMDGWKLSQNIPDVKLDVAGGSGNSMWSKEQNQHLFFWKNLFLNGTPRNASVYVNTCGKYSVYVNGSMTLKDTVGKREFSKIDSATGIVALLKGGDNVIAIEVTVDSGQSRGVGLILNALIDTTQRFQPSMAIPAAFASFKNDKLTSEQASDQSSASAAAISSNIDKNAYINKYRNKGEFLKAIADFESKESETNNQIRLEEGEIRKVRVQKSEIESNLQKVINEIAELKAKNQSLSREK